jgi:hypothetical protein
MLNNIAAILDAGVAASTNSYESIMTVTVGAGGQATISFTSIPATYKHLQLRGILKDSRNVGVLSNAYMQFNSDSGSNYANHNLYGEGSGVASEAQTSMTSMLFANIASATTTANMFAGFVTDILDYTSTTKNKTIRTLGGADNNGSGQIYLKSGLWMNSGSAVTTITLTPLVANFTQYSQVALYGIKG